MRRFIRQPTPQKTLLFPLLLVVSFFLVANGFADFRPLHQPTGKALAAAGAPHSCGCAVAKKTGFSADATIEAPLTFALPDGEGSGTAPLFVAVCGHGGLTASSRAPPSSLP